MEFECQSCDATFELIHEEKGQPGYCPFCSVPMNYFEEEEYIEEDYSDEE